MARLLDLNVDVIVAINTPPAMAAKHATKHVPIVITAGDPVEVGLVASLSRPGANVTGIAFQSSEVRAKTLQIFRELVPRSSPIGFVMLSSKNPNVELGWKRLEVAARELGAKIYRIEVDGVDDIERAFARMTQARIGGFLLSAEAVFLSRMQHIVDLAAGQKLPAMYPQRGFVEAGGLMSHAPRPGDVARRLLPQYVDRILRGASPADLPVEQPQLELVINVKAARALGLTIPPSLLARADQVIE